MVGNLALVGLTGGIGSGKSTVARLIADCGIAVLDADQIARDIVAPGEPALAEIAALWPQAVAPNGTLDRLTLGALVFADPEARAKLQAITHPKIQNRAMDRVRALEAEGHKVAVYEAALLVETGRHKDFDALIVVTAPEDVQVQRAVARGPLSEVEVRARLGAQLPLAEKIKVASHVVDNGGSLESTRSQVIRLVDDLRRRFGA
ncbi:MAG: dephospho-CoA kinase [Deltaproteobacteria bacterium]|nr:dephospho-CoA kinase [Deltaproteobacteria bacterium]